MKRGKRAQGMQFGWLFAIIIGAFILFFAVFFSGKLIQTGTYQSEAEMSKSLDILLNPFASIGHAEISLSKAVRLPGKTTVNFSCDAGKDLETIKVLVEKSKQPFSYDIKNKYIFSEDFNTRDLWIFSKPFNMPWRVDDLIFVISRNYCFVDTNAPDRISKELGALNSTFIQMVSDKTKCKTGALKVCFPGTGCDISVLENQVKTKTGKLLPYIDDATMYGAIFGPKDYLCNFERLMKRLGMQTEIFIEKVKIVSSEGCIEAESLKEELAGMQQAIINDRASIQDYADNIENKNMISCPLY